MDELLSRAVVVYLGGDSALFRRARDRPSLNYSVLVAEVGEQKAEEVREQTDQLIAEALAVEVDWYEHGLVAAIALVEAELIERHPELSYDAIWTIGNAFSWSQWQG